MNVAEVCRVPEIDRRAIPAGADESRWTARDGHSIRRIDWQPGLVAAPRGSLLFVPGRGDSYEKYLETLEFWHRQGWYVTSLDWRGQSGSGRLGADEVTGHVDDFGVWIDDLAQFWAEWKAERPAPHILIGHSMGGHVVLRAMAERKIDPDAVVLAAPMLGLHPSFVPSMALHGLAVALGRLGDLRRPAWKWSEKPGQPPPSRIELLTHDADRYADELWWREQRPELVMGPASWGWVGAALASIRRLDRPGALEVIEQPVLMLATTADRLVSFNAIERAVRRLPRAELLAFGAEARHEILREADPVRDRALAAIEEFLDRTAPVYQR